MTPEQLEAFWASDPTILRPIEAQEVEAVQEGVGLVPIAVGIGAAYLVYRRFMSERIKQAIKDRKRSPSRSMLSEVTDMAFKAFSPHWVAMIAPYIIAGYLEGFRLTKMGFVPTEYLEQIAYGYAQELGNHINEVSKEALLSGYVAQINRKVPEVKAAQRVADAYGVPPRAMNTLVNLWTTEDPKALTDRPVRDIKSMTAQNIIATQNELRARVTGENEYWAARTQAKQLVWMYGVENGIIPSTARRTWVTAADEKVCRVCGPMHMVAVPVGEQFRTSSGMFWTPPAHINCRCDVVLDFSFQDEMEAGLRNLLDQAEQTPVTKALGDDPYDRDKRGRFASSESRTRKPLAYKEPTQTIKLPSIQLPDQDDLKIEEAMAAARAELETPVKYKAPTFGGGGFKGYKAPSFKQTEFKSDFKSPGFKSEFKIEFSPEFTVGFNKMAEDIKYNAPRDFDKGKKTSEGDWEPLEHPVVMLMTASNMVLNDVVITDDKTELYELRSTDSVPDQYERSLLKAVSAHWAKAIDELTADYESEFNDVLSDIDVGDGPDVEHNPRVLWTDADGHRYLISSDAFHQALIEQVNGIPRAASDKVTLYSVYDPQWSVELRAYDLIGHMDIEGLVDLYTPTLVVMNHAGPAHYRKTNDVHINPGKWRLGDLYEGRSLAHMPYYAFYATPQSLEEDFDE